MSFSLDTSIPFHSDRFISLHQSNGRCATNKYFQIIGSIHDIESYFGIDNTVVVNVQIYMSHWGHLAIIFLWVSRNLFHIGWNGNYSLWVLNPIATIPIAHGIWDPDLANTNNWLFISGFNSVFHLYNFVMHVMQTKALSVNS